MPILNARGRLSKQALAAIGLTLSLLVGMSFQQGATAQGTDDDPCSAFVAATPAAEGQEGHSAGAVPGATPAVGLPELDLAFIDLMSRHHGGAIAMGEIALAHAEHEEIATLGQQIIDVQRAEQEQLRAWRDAWFPDTPIYDDALLMAVFDQAMAKLDLPADGGSLDHLDPAHDAQILCTSHEPFDLAFIDRMTSHHEAAIDMANVVLVAETNDELKVFAQKVIDAQTAEIAQMEIWREQWFGATPVA